MRSQLPKVLHEAGGKTLLARVLATARKLKPDRIHVVVGPRASQVREEAAGPGVHFRIQPKRLGTADAVQRALPGLGKAGTVLVLHSDVVLVRPSSLRKLAAKAAQGRYANLTMRCASPYGYGRIVRDRDDSIRAIVGERDASIAQRAIAECDAGPIAAPLGWLRMHLPKVGLGRRQRERMLPDLVAAAVASGLPVRAVEVDEHEAAGINSPAQLAAVEDRLGRARIMQLAQRGLELADPASVSLRGTLRAGPGAFIDRNVLLEGDVALGAGARIGPNCIIRASSIGPDTAVDAFSLVEGARIGAGCEVGPFARLRTGTVLKDRARIGNFVETKNAVLAQRATAKHLAYIGDAALGKYVNIGAGTVFCNYDGKRKHKSAVGKRAMIGAGTMLVAPVTVGEDATVAAGSVITKNVPAGSLAFGRARQATRLRPRKRKGKGR